MCNSLNGLHLGQMWLNSNNWHATELVALSGLNSCLLHVLADILAGM